VGRQKDLGWGSKYVSTDGGGAAGRCNVFNSSSSPPARRSVPIAARQSPSTSCRWIIKSPFTALGFVGLPPAQSGWPAAGLMVAETQKQLLGDAFGAVTRGSLPLHQLDVGHATPLSPGSGLAPHCAISDACYWSDAGVGHHAIWRALSQSHSVGVADRGPRP
jgi:hypothetical protein